MKKIEITREQLTSLYDVSDCTDWIHPINQLLSSTNDDVILIPEDLISELNTKATWVQIKAVLELNVLHINYPTEAYEFVLDLFNNKSIQKDNTWLDSEGKWLFEIGEKNKYFCFSYYRVYLILVEKYLCNNLQISKLITDVVYNVLKRKDLTPVWFYPIGKLQCLRY